MSNETGCRKKITKKNENKNVQKQNKKLQKERKKNVSKIITLRGTNGPLYLSAINTLLHDNRPTTFDHIKMFASAHLCGHNH